MGFWEWILNLLKLDTRIEVLEDNDKEAEQDRRELRKRVDRIELVMEFTEKASERKHLADLIKR